MKNNTIYRLLILACALTLVIGCGGGGGGVGGGVSPSGTTQPTSAAIKIALEGIASSSPINGVQAILHLPAGVTVKANQNAPQTDIGVVTSSGADLVMGVYSAATGSVTVYVAKTSGIAVGEFATINCDIDPGNFPKASDFSVSDLSAWDTNGALITGLTPTFTATIN
jgi:hypothetical protein